VASLPAERYTVRMKLNRLILSLALACTAVSAFAQWQWIDKDGRKVFSDRAPPPDILEKNIISRPAGRNSAPAANAPAEQPAGSAAASTPASAALPKPGGVDKDLEEKKKQAADAEAAKRKAEVENCARAKQGKATYDSGVRISRSNAAGEREVLDDAARAAEIKRIQSVIDSDCK
jgi:Domain of unknown function (DUF4124)